MLSESDANVETEVDTGSDGTPPITKSAPRKLKRSYAVIIVSTMLNVQKKSLTLYHYQDRNEVSDIEMGEVATPTGKNITETNSGRAISPVRTRYLP